MIRELERLVIGLDAIYAQRYGRIPLGAPAESLVLFSREAHYRLVQHRSRHLHGLAATGHVSRGTVFFFVGERRRHEIRSTLAHELGHLLNRRAIGPALPPWLDEGIGDDFASGEMASDGRYHPERLSGFRLDWGGHHSFEGGWAALLNLERAVESGDLPKLQTLLSFDWQAFMAGDSRLYYDASSFWIRFLLDDPEGPQADALHAFLEDVAAGQSVDPERLRQRLGQPWSNLDTAFRAWIVTQARKLRSNPP